MYAKGDTIIYNPVGVCQITDIRVENMTGSKMKYYILKPVYSNASTIYVPVNNEVLVARIHTLMSKKEIQKILKSDIQSDVSWVSDSKKRVVEYNEILSKNVREDAIKIIRLLYNHKKEVLQTNHKFYASDERILDTAEKLIGEEFGFVLQKEPNEIIASLI